MSEDPRNIGMVCKEHASKPDPKLAKLPPESFVGKYVKKGFPGKGPIGNDMKEHMWVLVKEVEDGKLSGILNNDPQFCDYLHDGSLVVVAMDEIEDVC